MFVRGKCVEFSSNVINKFLGRSATAEKQQDIISLDKIVKEITAGQVKSWPKKGNLSTSKLSIKYAILYKIGSANWSPTNHTSSVSTVLARLIYAVGTKTKLNFGGYNF